MTIKELERTKRELLKHKAGCEKFLDCTLFKMSDRQRELYVRRLDDINSKLNAVEIELTAKRKNRKRWG